jgi:hypothetical protein
MTAVCARLDRTMADGIFFGQDTASIAIAKSICATCPLMEACAAQAIEDERGLPTRERHGVFGGLTPAQRRKADPGRSCLDCGADITALPSLARRCEEHQAAHRHEMKLAHARRQRVAA